MLNAIRRFINRVNCWGAKPIKKYEVWDCEETPAMKMKSTPMQELGDETMKYKIISGHNAEVLTEAVGKEMKDGWTPLGGVAVGVWKERGNYDEYPAQTDTYFEWSQTMTKEDWKRGNPC